MKKKFPLFTMSLVVTTFAAGIFLLARNRPETTNAYASNSMMKSLATASISAAPPTASTTPVVTITPTVDEVGTALVVVRNNDIAKTDEAIQTANYFSAITMQVATSDKRDELDADSTSAIETEIIKTDTADETKVAKTSTSVAEQSNNETAVPITKTSVAGTQTIEQNQLSAEIASLWIWKVGVSVAGVGFLWLVLFGAYHALKYLQRRADVDIAKKSEIKRDEKGNLPVVKEQGKFVNLDLQIKPVLDPTITDDGFTNQESLENAANSKNLDMVRVLANSPAMAAVLNNPGAKRSGGNSDMNHSMPTANVKITKPEPATSIMPKELTLYPELPLPGLDYLNQWDGKLLPFGVNDHAAIMQADPTVRPHYMVVGRSGSGKTLSSIRPMVACLLTMGWSVVTMGKRVDFMPFANHPNFKLLAVDVRKDAQKYITLLQTLTAQMDVRDQLLAARGVSTWERYGAASTMIVIDDYSGAIERMPKKQASEVVSEVKTIALDGRKYGLNLLIGLQSPTWENLSTSIRSNMARIVYSVDAGYSRVALDEAGAEKLPAQWHFLTRMTDDASIQHGVGFRLFDEEIDAFLASRPVPQNEPLDWAEAENNHESPVSSAVTPETPTSPEAVEIMALDEARKKAMQDEDAEIALEERIASVWLSWRDARTWKGWNQFEREVYGEVKNGARQVKIKNMIASVQGMPNGISIKDITAEIEKLVATWGTTEDTTRSTTPGTTDGTTVNMPTLGLNSGSVVA